MSDKERSRVKTNQESKVVKLKEGMVKKGGVNSQPSTSRPTQPPKGQQPKTPQSQKKD